MVLFQRQNFNNYVVRGSASTKHLNLLSEKIFSLDATPSFRIQKRAVFEYRL